MACRASWLTISSVRLVCLMLLALLFVPASWCGDWQRFRGPNGSGVAEDGALPRELSADKNVVWKTAIPAGKSSPVVTADRIYLTGHENGKLGTFALERKSGKMMWSREAPGNREEKRNKLNDPASPTPVTDGSSVYVFFA